MSEPYIGQIAIFGFNFAPQNWLFCNGTVLSISQNQAFFAVIGTNFGGNGTTTFAVPNIQDCGVVGTGQGPGLSPYVIGESVGVPNVTLTTAQMPAHNHIASGTAGSASSLTVANGYWMGDKETGNAYLFAPSPDGTNSFAAATISNAGGAQPHVNQQPYLGMNFCIAQYGVFPSRS